MIEELLINSTSASKDHWVSPIGAGVTMAARLVPLITPIALSGILSSGLPYISGSSAGNSSAAMTIQPFSESGVEFIQDPYSDALSSLFLSKMLGSSLH